jgi:hypothetical protein
MAKLGHQPGRQLMVAIDAWNKTSFSQRSSCKMLLQRKGSNYNVDESFHVSQQNNVEMGIYISKEKDDELYKQVADEVDRIKRGSEHRKISVQKVEKNIESPKEQAGNRKKEPKKQTGPQQGYCIRTGVKIPFNVEKPMTYEAYKLWSKYGDPDYPEKYCHFTGDPSEGETSVTRPILKMNWKRAKEVFNL